MSTLLTSRCYIERHCWQKKLWVVTFDITWNPSPKTQVYNEFIVFSITGIYLLSLVIHFGASLVSLTCSFYFWKVVSSAFKCTEKNVQVKRRSTYLMTVEMSTYGSLVLLISMWWSPDGVSIQKHGFFYGWTILTFVSIAVHPFHLILFISCMHHLTNLQFLYQLSTTSFFLYHVSTSNAFTFLIQQIPVVLNAFGGILVGLVTQYSGGIKKVPCLHAEIWTWILTYFQCQHVHLYIPILIIIVVFIFIKAHCKSCW